MESFPVTRLATPKPVREFAGIPVVVEWKKGETRTGHDPSGKPWSRLMLADYGYIPDTVGKEGDGEDLDVYLGSDESAPNCYLIEQLDEDGERDEFKLMLGFDDAEEATSTYLKHYPEGWEDRVGDVQATSVERLRELLPEGAA